MIVPPRRLGLVGCVKQKWSWAGPAQDLYISTLFRGRRHYVEHTCDRWFILSAVYGLVDPLTLLEPYDVTMKDATTAQRRAWSERVLRQIDQAVEPQPGDLFQIHAGAEYRNFGLDAGLLARRCRVEIPTEGLPIGKQLQFYKNAGRRS